MKQKEQSMSTEGALPATIRDGTPDDARGGPLGAVELSAADSQILACISGDQHREAIRLCARHHGPAIGRLCMALTGSPAEADDLTQETLLSAHDAFSSYRAEGSPRAWLLGIARRKCARHVERSARREAKLRLVREEQPSPQTDELVLQRQRAEHARAALEQVRPTEREALVLRYTSELSYRELAEACGIEESAARKRVSRAIAALRSVLGDKE
jgi:RNA polymerase sigma-70 factor (ECF subfamily)